MLRLLNSPNTLISLLDRFFIVKDIDIGKVRAVINESSANELVPAFFYLENWLSTNISTTVDPSTLANLQGGFQLIGIISSRVPLAVLLNGLFDVNWGIYQPHWLLQDFYLPTNARIERLRSYIKPFALYGHLITFDYESSDADSLLSNVMVELEIDPSFQTSCRNHFKRLIMNRFPISSFKPLIRHNNAKVLLTHAITEIFSDLNISNNVTQEQLLFSFSSFFLYIHSFTLTNEINGQILCEYLQSRPYISPFCMLALVNHIPMNMYLYNLLAPRECSSFRNESLIEESKNNINNISNSNNFFHIMSDNESHNDFGNNYSNLSDFESESYFSSTNLLGNENLLPNRNNFNSNFSNNVNNSLYNSFSNNSNHNFNGSFGNSYGNHSNINISDKSGSNLDTKSCNSNSWYNLIDVTFQQTFQSLIQHIPKILDTYFSPSTEPSKDLDTNQGIKCDNIAEFLSAIHLSSSSIYGKMKCILSLARDHNLGPVHIAGMGVQLLRCITFSLQRTLEECVEKKMFTPTLCLFMRNIFNILTPTLSELLQQRFFDLSNAKPKQSNYLIRSAVLYILPSLLNMNNNNFIIPFCVNALKWEESQVAASYMIMKLLRHTQPKFSKIISDVISSSKNSFLELEFIDALSNSYFTATAKEKMFDDDFCKKLVQKMPVTFSLKNGYYFIDSITNEKIMQDEPFAEIFTALSRITVKNAIRELTPFLQKEIVFVALKFMVLTRLMQSREFASYISDTLKSLMTQINLTEADQMRFEIRRCELALPVAQACFERLLCVGYHDIATDLLSAMAPVIKTDIAPLHWMQMFLRRCRKFTNSDIKQLCIKILKELPCADKYLILEENMNMVNDADTFSNINHHINQQSNPNPNNSNAISASNSVGNSNNSHDINGLRVMINRYGKLIAETIKTFCVPDPDVINHEYQSIFEHILSFAACSVMLSNKSNDQIAESLTYTIVNICVPHYDRDDSCLAIGRLATRLNYEISYAYFLKMMDIPFCEISKSCAQMFLMCCTIDLYREICNNCAQIIRSEDDRLDHFIQMIMPSFTRLHGDEATTITFLCGILESVTDKTPDELKEVVVDAVGLVYIKMNLFKSRSTLIGASRKFDPFFREIIASTLEVGVPNDISFANVARKWHKT
ncbi:hypothetical protein TRFO_14828 [Tritrichomonas foetus]|uniref:Uncharacterized protein n=1 Tax=Tritrichomonas foetus TaxID=1144522 RepID=A0A1J4KUP2_9EUKA|nr:hypothetical protein TRFO_14828 [Tritrichomonas foetus]|eukprot:OHT14858.1 hypothetical protein TRFO_14828 [Tritrichomonas foetus]